MPKRLGLLRRTALLLVVFPTVLIFAQQPAGESARLDRLVALARLWAAVKYFHPYLAYRDNIDWDRALVKAIPKVDSAQNAGDYSAAVDGMLKELGDPVTRVLDSGARQAQNGPPAGERQPIFRTDPTGVLVVTMTNYSDFQDFNGAREKLIALKKKLPTAHAVVFDLRPSVLPSDSDHGMASYAISSSGLAGALTSISLDLPGERRRMHIGYPPQDGSTSGNYSSGFYLQGSQSIKPEAGGKDLPMVFLIGPHSDIPDLALAAQASGRGAIVAEGSFDEGQVVTTRNFDLPDGVSAQVRLGELVYADGATGFAPNLTVPASAAAGRHDSALQAAIDLAKVGKFSPPARGQLSGKASPQRDKTYDDMPYPSSEYRVLAAFRIWAVIHYFFPYKEFIGEDWDAVLREFIPRMEHAKDAVDYNLAAAEMVTHIHDTHGFMNSPVLQKYFGEASLPVRVRNIEGVPVITGFTDEAAAKAAGLEIGDVVLKVDGEDAALRIADRLKYTPHSTPQAGVFWATERGISQGPKESTATLSIRDLRGQVREVKSQRKAEYASKSMGDRTGDVLRVLPGNIGYADLDRLPVSRVDEMFDKFKDCPAIIFDDRGYPQGTAWEIAPRLTDKDQVVAALFRHPDAMSPDFSHGETQSEVVQETFYQRIPSTAKWRYHGKTVMLIDERTLSQAEHTGLFLEAANGTKFIGSPTQGANGDVTNFSLPGGIHVHFSGQGVWHADGRQLQRKGLQPDLEVRPTLAGIRAGKDEVLDRAVEYLTKGR